MLCGEPEDRFAEPLDSFGLWHEFIDTHGNIKKPSQIWITSIFRHCCHPYVGMAADIKTGKRPWAKRIFPMSVSIGGEGRLIALDHQGTLNLATVTRDGVTVHSRHQITEQYSFTAPTLVGPTLYLRDEKHIMALDVRPADMTPEGEHL